MAKQNLVRGAEAGGSFFSFCAIDLSLGAKC